VAFMDWTSEARPQGLSLGPGLERRGSYVMVSVRFRLLFVSEL
jgi:hypothetical protein